MILVPKKNIWLPERKWGQPKFQKGMLHPVGFWHTSGGGNIVTPTMTVGTQVLYTTKGPDPTGRGFDGGADYYSLGGFGSLSDTDLHGLTMSSIYWGTTQIMHFGIQGTGHSDADTTFIDIEINGTTWTRSSRTYYSSSNDGGTLWYWSTGATPPYNSSGDYTVTVTWA
jgi:hypothetical protein